MKAYRAVDLDGVLAHYDKWDGEIGKPIPEMIKRVKGWLKDGDTVVVFTARVFFDPSFYSSESNSHADIEFVTEQRRKIEKWCEKHIGVILPITSQKNPFMTDFYDDRAWRVVKNVGTIVGEWDNDTTSCGINYLEIIELAQKTGFKYIRYYSDETDWKPIEEWNPYGGGYLCANFELRMGDKPCVHDLISKTEALTWYLK